MWYWTPLSGPLGFLCAVFILAAALCFLFGKKFAAAFITLAVLTAALIPLSVKFGVFVIPAAYAALFCAALAAYLRRKNRRK